MSMQINVLVTGGTGYIGSHIVVELLQQNYNVVIVDNLSNSSDAVISLIKDITGLSVKCYVNDLNDINTMIHIIRDEQINVVIHCAGLKSISESYEDSLNYYYNNVHATISLLQAMAKNSVKKIIFSSTASVYKDLDRPVSEKDEIEITNPYTSTKHMIEDILQDVYQSDQKWSICVLRYFNPIGAHSSGKIGENYQGIPDNILPLLMETAMGKRKCFQIFGNDYNTIDGTGVRDYIHVVDVALCHVKALQYVMTYEPLFDIFNVGTGHGCSVKELIKTFEETINLTIETEIVGKRIGDVGISYAKCDKINQVLGWQEQYTLSDMCKDAWRWHQNKSQMDKESV